MTVANFTIRSIILTVAIATISIIINTYQKNTLSNNTIIIAIVILFVIFLFIKWRQKQPKYRTMKDLGFNNYKPIYSRDHLKDKDISTIKISLTKEEKQLFQHIKDAINCKQIFPEPVIIRCAGGWVRDKLLKCYSDDIDLAIDTMTGEQFAQRLQKYFQIKQETSFKYHKIAKNPEKSKHLETVTFTIGNIEVDAVNLRSETYNKYSRIPQMSFATAQEDARRRDLTINAMFYNINEDKIEDFTGKGLSDLITGIARTPLPAKQTFLDDSLRILRAIRHGITKFGFDLHDDIIIAAQNKEIHNSLRTIISEQRRGKEFQKMLNGCYVWIAFDCLVKFGLINILFEIPKSCIVPNTKLCEKDKIWEYGIQLTKQVTEMVLLSTNKQHVFNICDDIKIGKQIQKKLLFSAFTYPCHAIKWIDANSKKKGKDDSLVMYFVTHCIKGMDKGKQIAKTANKYHCGVNMIIELLSSNVIANTNVVKSFQYRPAIYSREEKENDIKQMENNGKKRLVVGKFLRLCKEDWVYVLYLTRAVCQVYNYDVIEVSIHEIDELQIWIENESKLVEKKNECWKWKSLIRGNVLLKKYKDNGLKADRRVGGLIQYILELRLSNPDITLNQIDLKIVEWLKQNPTP
eukprot:117308_1